MDQYVTTPRFIFACVIISALGIDLSRATYNFKKIRIVTTELSTNEVEIATILGQLFD